MTENKDIKSFPCNPSIDLVPIEICDTIKCEDDSTIKCGDIFMGLKGTYQFSCYFCNDIFTNFTYFVDHIEESHAKLFKHDEDNLCLQETNSLDSSSLNAGVVNTSASLEDPSSRSPSLCTDTSNDDNKRKKTKKKIQRKTPALQCKICNKKLLTEAGYNRHVEKHKQNPLPVERKFKCGYCDHVARFKSRLLMHEKTHLVQCKVCHKYFRDSNLLEAHMKSHEDTPQQCETCHKTLGDYSKLLAHVRRVHLDDKPHKCDFCEMRFVSPFEKKVHIRTHTGEKPYQCEECGSRFRESGSLRVHKINMHERVKKYACPICQKTFIRMKYLKNHMPVHTNDTPFQCNVCGGKFRRKKALTEHMKLHSEKKNYVCKLCGKEYAQNAGLYIHMKSHQ